MDQCIDEFVRITATGLMLFQLPTKQKELLVAIAKEGKASNITFSVH